MSATFVIQFAGWCILRIPTDPDPPDELRGVSGYTFAFAGEPDLDRIVRLQPPKDYVPRSHGPDELGVFVSKAERIEGKNTVAVPEFANAKVELLGEPCLENRNWTLTLPGYEPIYPFDLSIKGAGVRVRRSAPFYPDRPADPPIWKVPQEKLLEFGARGIEYEPETIGRATGLWDPFLLVTERQRLLKADLATATDPIAKAVLEGRIAELEIGIAAVRAGGSDRRIRSRQYVERFAFKIAGGDAHITGDPEQFRGTLDHEVPWPVSFWLGAWDPDLLCAYMEGSLQIPYATTP